MEVHKGFDSVRTKRAVVTTGSFDGVHLGHQVIIKRLNQRARELGGESVLITFYPHPRKVLYPETAGKDLKMISSQEEKIDRLQHLGLDHLIVVPFTLEFSKTTSVDFIRHYLVTYLQVKHVIIGFNHHFGYNREGDLEYLSELGAYYYFTVEEIPEQDIQNESVSSTKIRKALAEGNIQRANAYLDHPYQLSGEVISAQSAGPGLHSLSGIADEKLLPPAGSYAVSCGIGPERSKGVVWILSENGDGKPAVFFHLPAYEPISVGVPIRLDLHKRLGIHPLSGMPGVSRVQADLQQVENLIY